jgi:vesicle transport protein SEC22
MVKSVFIARKSDGLIFCEVSDECTNDKNLMSVRNKAIEYLKNFQTKQDLCTVNIGSQQFVFHYKINENIVYLIITEVKYPSKLAFCYLEDINEGFTDELKNHFGTQSVSYYSKLETIDRTNYFLKFEKFVKKKKAEYLDSGSKGNLEKLNKEILDVHKVMTENINLILDREKNLFNIDRISETIKTDSKTFKNKTHDLRIKLLLSKYSVFIAIGAIIILFIIFKIYL